MELQALLVLGGVAVAGIAVLLLMGLFSNSGTSYEEAIAQQRRATTELLALAENKNKPKKNSKKANKKLAKKEKNKENVAVTTASEPDSEAPAESGGEDDLVPVIKTHVDFCPPVVVDVPRDTPPNVKIRKRGKDPKVKPILINKEDPSCVSDPSMLPASADNTVTNHFEEMHPKDDFELLHSTLIAEKTPDKKEEIVEKKESKVLKSAKNLKSTSKPTAPVEVVKEEVSRERHNSGDAPKEQRKAKKVEKKSTSEEVVVEAREEVVPPLNAPQPTELTTDKLLKQALTAAPAPTPASPAPSPPANKNKKKKTEPNVLTLMAGDSGGVNVGELVRVVREAALSRTEIQILTDALLNKHHDPLPEHSEWTEGPNDPMQKMKKQLADKEKALSDEIEASKALHAKVKELRSSLNAEHARAAAASRAAEAGAAALHARLQRLLEDNHTLAQDKLMLQSKLGAEGEAQAQRVQMEMHIQRLSEAEAGLSQQVVALQAEAGARALEAGQARMEAAAARDALMHAQQHAADLAQQLQEASRACAELEQQRQCAALADQHLQQELRQLQERLAGMAELQNEVQRQANRAQAAENNADKIKEEFEKQKQQLSNELISLREQLAERESKSAKSESESAKRESESAKRESESVKRESELANRESELVERQSELGKRESELAKCQSELAVREAELAKRQLELAERETELAELKQMKVVPAQNGLPAANNTEQHKAAELAMVESVVESLRGELESARAAARDQREQLDRLRDQLATYQDKNNELRTKNWKVMEALQSAEKALQTKSASALPAQDSLRVAIEKAQESQYNEVASVLRAACPFAAPATRVGREWLQTFADNLKKELAKKDIEKKEVENKVAETTESPVNNDRLEDLLSQNEHLQGLVDKYKTIIDDTEEVLSRLQQKVSREEQQWTQQLADKQHELDDLRQRTLHQMQTKIDSLQEELQKAQAPNHNHSFADAERLTEEKLMAGLTEKLNVDLSNGPLQVGIEKK